MKVERINPTIVPAIVPRVTEAPSLTNRPCNVEIVITVKGYDPIKVTLENEEEARNVIARFAPSSLMEAHPRQVLDHFDDSTNPIFELLVATAKLEGLSIPEGI
jgi:hypothetical protein